MELYPFVLEQDQLLRRPETRHPGVDDLDALSPRREIALDDGGKSPLLPAFKTFCVRIPQANYALATRRLFIFVILVSPKALRVDAKFPAAIKAGVPEARIRAYPANGELPVKCASLSENRGNIGVLLRYKSRATHSAPIRPISKTTNDNDSFFNTVSFEDKFFIVSF